MGEVEGSLPNCSESLYCSLNHISTGGGTRLQFMRALTSYICISYLGAVSSLK